MPQPQVEPILLHGFSPTETAAMSISLEHKEFSPSTIRPTLTRAGTSCGSDSIITPFDGPVRTGNLFRKRFEAAKSRRHTFPNEPTVLDIPSPSLSDIDLDTGNTQTIMDKQDSYFPETNTNGRHVGTSTRTMSNCSPSAKNTNSRYEPLAPPSVTFPYAPSINSDSVLPRRPLPEIPHRSMSSKSRGNSSLRSSFRNLLSVFKSKNRGSDASSQCSMPPEVSISSLISGNASPRVSSPRSPVVISMDLSKRHSGQVLYLFRPQFDGMLPVWTDCLAKLCGTSVILEWKSAYGNPAMHSISLAKALDVRSVPFSEVNPTEKKLLPDSEGEVHVFEIQFEDGLQERFASGSVAARSAWVSAIWGVLIEHGRTGIQATYQPNLSKPMNDIQFCGGIASSSRSVSQDRNKTESGQATGATPLLHIGSTVSSLRRGDAEGRWTTAVICSSVTSDVDRAEKTGSRETEAKQEDQYRRLTATNLSLLSGNPTMHDTTQEYTGTGTIGPSKTTLENSVNDTFGRPSENAPSTAPTTSHTEGVDRPFLENVETQTIFSSTYSQTSQEELGSTAVPTTDTGSTRRAYMDPLSKLAQSTTIQHIEPAKNRFLPSSQLHVPPSIHSFHTQLTPTHLGCDDKAEDDLSVAGVSMYESCVSASQAHSTYGRTSQCIAERDEANRGEGNRETQPLMTSSSSMLRILNELRNGTRGVVSSKSIQYLSNIAAVKKRISAFTQKTRNDNPQDADSSNPSTSRIHDEPMQSEKCSPNLPGRVLPGPAISHHVAENLAPVGSSPAPHSPIGPGEAYSPHLGTMDFADSSAIVDLYRYMHNPVKKFALSPVMDVSEPPSPKLQKPVVSENTDLDAGRDTNEKPKHFPENSAPYSKMTSLQWEEVVSKVEELILENSNKQTEHHSAISSRVDDLQAMSSEILQQTRDTLSTEGIQAVLQPMFTELHSRLRNVTDDGKEKLGELLRSILGLKDEVTKLRTVKPEEELDGPQAKDQAPAHDLPPLPQISQANLFEGVEKQIQEIKDTMKESKILDITTRLDNLFEDRSTKTDLVEVNLKLNEILEKASLVAERSAPAVFPPPDDTSARKSIKGVVELHNEPRTKESVAENEGPEPPVRIPGAIQEEEAVEVIKENDIKDIKTKIDELASMLAENDEHKKNLSEQQCESIRYLNELNTWLESFASNGTAQLQVAHRHIEKLIHELCAPEDLQGKVPNTPEATPVTMYGLIQGICASVDQTKHTVSKLEAATVELASIMNAKINTPEEERDLALSRVVAMIDKQRQEQEQMLRGIAEELSNDIRGERLRFVEAMKEATAINVQVHVEEFKKELSREVLSMTQDVGRLQRERQMLEQQITELFAFFAKQRAEMEHINIERQRQPQEKQTEKKKSGHGSRNRPLPTPNQPGSAASTMTTE